MTIKDATDIDIGLALWTLAQFPKEGSLWSRITNIRHKSMNPTAMAVWHKETLGEAADEHLRFPPDIHVTKIIAFDKTTGKTSSMDDYLIEVNTQYVDPGLLDKIESRIMEEDAKTPKVGYFFLRTE